MRCLDPFCCHKYTGLQGASMFWRGFPLNGALQNPAVAHILCTALCENVIMDKMIPEVEESAALKWCFEQGWLHTISKNWEIAGHFFVLLLHWLFLEWKLYHSLYDL